MAPHVSSGNRQVSRQSPLSVTAIASFSGFALSCVISLLFIAGVGIRSFISPSATTWSALEERQNCLDRRESNSSDSKTCRGKSSNLGISPVSGPLNTATPFLIPITVLDDSSETGVCLDGTPPAYHFSPGWGSGVRKWVVFLEGGAWCTNVRECRKRSKTRLGSSSEMRDAIPFEGILSNNSDVNPLFFNWNAVYVRYCDGSSFTGRPGPDGPVSSGVHVDGQKVFERVVHHLLFAKGMQYATHALLAGCSAGGLAALLHCDQFKELIQSRWRGSPPAFDGGTAAYSGPNSGPGSDGEGSDQNSVDSDFEVDHGENTGNRRRLSSELRELHQGAVNFANLVENTKLLDASNLAGTDVTAKLTGKHTFRASEDMDPEVPEAQKSGVGDAMDQMFSGRAVKEQDDEPQPSGTGAEGQAADTEKMMDGVSNSSKGRDDDGNDDGRDDVTDDDQEAMRRDKTVATNIGTPQSENDIELQGDNKERDVKVSEDTVTLDSENGDQDSGASQFSARRVHSEGQMTSPELDKVTPTDEYTDTANAIGKMATLDGEEGATGEANEQGIEAEVHPNVKQQAAATAQVPVVKCLSDAGFFPDIEDVSGGRYLWRLFSSVVDFHQPEVNSNCLQSDNSRGSVECFFPELFLLFTSTPYFILNPLYDLWLIRHAVIPDDEDLAAWSSCRKNIDKCSEEQLQQLHSYRVEIMKRVKKVLNFVNLSSLRSDYSGAFLDSCRTHCQSLKDARWNGAGAPVIGNKTMAQVIAAWFLEEIQEEFLDCEYPCNPSCSPNALSY